MCRKCPKLKDKPEVVFARWALRTHVRAQCRRGILGLALRPDASLLGDWGHIALPVSAGLLVYIVALTRTPARAE